MWRQRDGGAGAQRQRLCCLSAGYFNSDPFPRPTGQIPIIQDPRDPGNPSATVSGATYPATPAARGSSFENSGTSQPKFNARRPGDRGQRITYEGGVAGTSGIIHSGVGPFDVQKGSVLGYAKVNYRKGRLKVNAFTNRRRRSAESAARQPVDGTAAQLNFSTQTYDVEIGDTLRAGTNRC